MQSGRSQGTWGVIYFQYLKISKWIIHKLLDKNVSPLMESIITLIWHCSIKDENVELQVTVTPEQDTVWLTQEQMAELFNTARSSIAHHIRNIFNEGEIDKNTSVEIFDTSNVSA